ncbi:conserved hypothetical protein [Frankia canadensis]|uniref:Uncharacterized protein n=1 Tax=Frankia canadensis TaxID=1836972 RepID=A0A2I2KSU7_9ACTN|nr:hypothetical protein [Frankia canadensis]SNQ48753.1 conserved hypothetical protein [Frankia canadensis]SOU56043.1 conserved hypothetical protein [Frankia canadensis]
MNSWIDLDALWHIVAVGLLAGAGLPAVFALGLRAVSLPGRGGAPDAETTPDARTTPGADRIIGTNPIGIAAGALCFAIVLAGIAWGIYSVVAGT